MKLSTLLLDFSGFSDFVKKLVVCSPQGRALASEMCFYVDRNLLEVEYNRVEVAASFLATHSDKVEFLRCCLKRLPLLPKLSQKVFSATDIFLIKKLVVNSFKISQILSQQTKTAFELDFGLEELRKVLGNGDLVDGDETFYLADNYSEALRSVRGELRKIEAAEKQFHKVLIDSILNDTGMDFRYRDFLVISSEIARNLDRSRFVVDPFDSHNFVVRPVVSNEMLLLAASRDLVIAQEKEQEELVYKQISAVVHQFADALTACSKSLALLDFAVAKAQLAADFAMVRPSFCLESSVSDNSNINKVSVYMSLKEGRYIPLIWRCNSEQHKYWPLSIDVSHRANIVFGSNMGGKTIVLRSLAFFQTLAQMGFFVPAKSFVTTMFGDISYVGVSNHQKTNCSFGESAETGLSGFGVEISSFMQSWNSGRKPNLLLIDEFASTTNSFEASALVAAVLRKIGDSSDKVGVVSSHFVDMKGLTSETCGFYRMRGLSQQGVDAIHIASSKGSLSERLQRINSYMEYEVVEENSLVPVRDAFSIAEALGFPMDILNDARRSLGE